MRKPLFLLFPF